MMVIAVNFVVPLSVMFYCYYNVSVTVNRYKASNSLDNINIDWSDQMDVTKVEQDFTSFSSPNLPSVIVIVYNNSTVCWYKIVFILSIHSYLSLN